MLTRRLFLGSALGSLGATAVPLNYRLAPEEAAYIVDNSRATAIIGSAKMRAVCEQLEEHLPNGLPPLRMIADADLDLDRDRQFERAAHFVGDHLPETFGLLRRRLEHPTGWLLNDVRAGRQPEQC